MEWSDLYGMDSQPDFDKISEYVNNELWQTLTTFLQNTCHIQPKLTYSRCSMQRGWNVKYQKGGKSLCTLYPMAGYFIALVVIGNKELAEAELLMPLCSEYTQVLFQKAGFSAGGSRWLMMDVTEPVILDDVVKLIRMKGRLF